VPLVRITCPNGECLSSISADSALLPGKYESMCPQGHRLWIVKDFRGAFTAFSREYSGPVAVDSPDANLR
jgi:hypothetical protein